MEAAAGCSSGVICIDLMTRFSSVRSPQSQPTECYSFQLCLLSRVDYAVRTVIVKKTDLEGVTDLHASAVCPYGCAPLWCLNCSTNFVEDSVRHRLVPVEYEHSGSKNRGSWRGTPNSDFLEDSSSRVLICFPKVGLCNLHPVCVSVYPPPICFEWRNQSLRNLICISWHLSPSQRRSS
jgi:hypothetical protein